MRAQEFTTEADNIFRLPPDRPDRSKTTGGTGTVRPFKGPRPFWQDLDPVILQLAYEWFWATVQRDSLVDKKKSVKVSPGEQPDEQFNTAATNVLKIEDKLARIGFLISINNEGNIELADNLQPDRPIVLPSQDAAKSSGWAANFD